jgi:hypothetical protein
MGLVTKQRPPLLLHLDLRHRLRSTNKVRCTIRLPPMCKHLENSLIYSAIGRGLRDCAATNIGSYQYLCVTGRDDLRGQKHQQYNGSFGKFEAHLTAEAEHTRGLDHVRELRSTACRQQIEAVLYLHGRDALRLSIWSVSVTSPAIGSALRPSCRMLCAAASLPASLRSSRTR